ncbi:MAG: DNA polymerase III subunit delta [bacterium]
MAGKTVAKNNIKYSELLSGIRRGDIAPVYLFSGDEAYLREEAIRRMEESLLGDCGREFNYDLIYADEAGITDIMNAASSLPFLSKKRLVVVKRLEKLKQAAQKKLLEFLEDPVETTCLVLVVGARINKTSEFFGKLSRKAVSVVFWPLFDNEVIPWIQNASRKRAKTISTEAAAYLKEYVGNDLFRLGNQIDQVIMYTGERKSIGLKDVEDVTADIRVGDIYEMIDAIGARQKGRSLKILNKLLEKGEEPVSILWHITARLRKFLEAQELMRKNIPYMQLARQLGINTFMDKNFQKHAGSFSETKLMESFSDMLEVDRDIKTGRKNSRLTLELLILRLCT